MSEERRVTSISAKRVPATTIKVGDEIALIGLIYFTVEWVRADDDGAVYMAGISSKGRPHVTSTSEAAMVSKVFRLEHSK